jgi:hypothetical protein
VIWAFSYLLALDSTIPETQYHQCTHTHTHTHTYNVKVFTTRAELLLLWWWMRSRVEYEFQVKDELFIDKQASHPLLPSPHNTKLHNTKLHTLLSYV